MSKKILLGFYEGVVEPYINNLNGFEENGFEVQIFDNITADNLKEFNLENILSNILGDSYGKCSINIISNIEQLILNLYNRYTFDYNSFIFDNSLFIKEYESFVEKNKSYNYRSNLYSIKKWGCNFEYSILKDTNVDDFGVLGVKNFINSVKELFEDRNEFSKYYESICDKAIKANEYIINLDEKNKREIEKLFVNTFHSRDILYKIYIGSFLINTFKSKEYGNNFLNAVLEAREIDKNHKFYIMYQLISKGFTDIELNKSLDDSKMDKIYDDVFYEFKKSVGEFRFIPKEERNEDLVIVFISQFLRMEHGPTKTALDRCYTLSKYLDKKVILINTKEIVTSKGMLPIYDSIKGNVIEKYSNHNNFEYKDINISYYQPECSMPDENECRNILNFIKKEKPYLLLNIGGYSITADLAAQVIPMATISTSGNYSISKNKGQFFIMGRKPMESDYEYIAKEGHTKDSIIECPFTFELKPQKHEYTRESFGIPKNKFVIVVIGARLDKEIDEEFLCVLNNLASKDYFVVTIGNYNLSEEMGEKYLNLKDNFKALGFQKDILACVDLIDLYINPKRQGGGTSAVECMFKGKPALSLRYGDVSMIVDEHFLCDNYYEMINLTIKCREDINFYKEMSGKASAKAADMMDTKKYFVKMYNDIINSPTFK
jgi:UDP-N-acetylglucosamine:LPS N-acetylglucosamine transferase